MTLNLIKRHALTMQLGHPIAYRTLEVSPSMPLPSVTVVFTGPGQLREIARLARELADQCDRQAEGFIVENATPQLGEGVAKA